MASSWIGADGIKRYRSVGVPSQPRRTRPRRVDLAAIAVLLLGLLTTSVATWAFVVFSDLRDEQRMANAVQATQDRISGRLDDYTALLVATRSFMEVVEPDAWQFHRFVKHLDLESQYTGLQGIGFTQRLSRAEKERVEEGRRAEGLPGFTVWPTWPRDEYHTIVYLEPQTARNVAAMGYDMFSEPVRRMAMETARDTGNPTASGKVTLVQEIDEDVQAGFLIYLPVYRRGVIPHLLAERRRDLLGFVYAPFRVDDLLTGIFGTEKEPRVAFELYDETFEPGRMMYRSPELPLESGRTKEATLDVAGRTWALRFTAMPAWEAASFSRGIPVVLSVGIVLSVAMMLFVRSRSRVQEERQELLERERRTRAEAEAANRSKDEFLALLGHELRNPLAPIVSALDLLRQKAPNEAKQELRVLDRQLQHVVRLVDDLLDVSRITRGKLEMQWCPVSVQEVITRAVETASPALEARGQRLEVETSRELTVLGDEGRLVQVVANLLTNAVKFSPKGGEIWVRSWCDGNAVLISVRDAGIGIVPELLPHIFDMFVQGHASLARTEGGLGLGLTLVKNLVIAHGGTVVAESEGFGRGSEFIVKLPRLDAEAWVRAPSAPPFLSVAPVKKRVLVVDDNRDAAELWRDGLRSRGHEVELAHDGAEALRRAAEFQPEVVLLDIGLPVMDGFEVGKRLQATSEAQLIAVTGYGQPQDRARTRAAGFKHHFVKPVPLEQIILAIEQPHKPDEAAI